MSRNYSICCTRIIRLWIINTLLNYIEQIRMSSGLHASISRMPGVFMLQLWSIHANSLRCHLYAPGAPLTVTSWIILWQLTVERSLPKVIQIVLALSEGSQRPKCPDKSLLSSAFTLFIVTTAPLKTWAKMNGDVYRSQKCNVEEVCHYLRKAKQALIRAKQYKRRFRQSVIGDYFKSNTTE